MAEYIEREAAIEAAKHAWAKNLEPSQYIEIIPAADVAPVRHGKWEDKPNPQWKAYDIRYCTLCGWSIHKSKLRNADLSWRYCPNCGAKMDLEA